MEKKPPKLCVAQAPSKINLHLRVGEKRPDGFHDIESVFATLAFADTLRFERVGEEGESVLDIHWEAANQPIIAGENLILKALSLFRKETGFRSAFHIRLDKRIPVGAGLGGGSSNAASTLLALNLFAGSPLSPQELSEMAALLGSDVPFFLIGGAALVGGRGERIEPVKTPEGLWVLLVTPPFSSYTAHAYRLLDETRAGFRAANQSSDARNYPKKSLIQSLEQSLENHPKTWPFFNDFLPVFLAENGANAAAYRSILDDLRQAGASFAGLSGSGSCCFGVFTSKEAAERAENELSGTGRRENGDGQKNPSYKKNTTNLTFFLARNAKAVLEY